jgi:branched-chain amino acid transport system substrate-binding protein
MPGRPRTRAHHRTYTRRSFIASSAAAGATLAAGPVFAPAVHAQARPIRIGYVSPATGPLAPFAAADEFMLQQFREATKGGLKVGNATRPIEVLLRDSQSNPNRAAEVAKTLIVNDRVDLILVGNTPETTNPVCTQAEIEEVATISSLAPWQPWFFGQQGNPAQPRQFNFVFHYFWGLEDVIAVFTNMWSQLDSNKVVGALFPNDGDGNAWGDKERGFPPELAKQGYRLVDPGRYENLTDNFAAQITAFKNANAQIITGVVLPPDFTTFWKQALQQGFKPRAASVGKAILFPSSVEALARDGHNLSSEVWWTPNHPFRSSINGMTARQLADAYTAATKRQWSQPIGFAHSLYEVALDVLKRTKEIGNARATVEAIRATKLDTVVGHIEWNGQGVPPFAAKNVTKTSLVGGQWRVRDGNRYDIVITDNRTAPSIPVGGRMEPIA